MPCGADALLIAVLRAYRDERLIAPVRLDAKNRCVLFFASKEAEMAVAAVGDVGAI